jgi:hypothetical protein
VVRSASGHLIKGKTEADWIKSIDYNGDSAETERWRTLGPDGLRILIRALNAGNGPIESRYPRLWGRLPPFFRNYLPAPVNSYPTRMCAASMLRRLEASAKPVFANMIRALKREKTEGVQEGIIGCFSYEHNCLKSMKQEQADLLPVLTAAMQSSNWGVRNDAALALGSYSDHAEATTPVLLNAIHDSNAEVQMAAAGALRQIAPRSAARMEVVDAVIKILKNPDDQIALPAAEWLGETGTNALPAVPVLIEYAHGTNRLMASVAARALRRIDPAAAAEAGIK